MAASLASTLVFCMGVSWAWTSPMMPLLMSQQTPVGTEPMTEDTVSWLSSISFIGSLIGTLFWDIASLRLGIKATLCLVTVPYIISWIMVLLAQDVTWLIMARLIIGIGNNGATVIAPIFLSEITENDLRGCFGSLLMTFVSGGMLFSNVIGYYLKYEGLAVSSMLIPILFLPAIIIFPETPIRLWQNGEYRKAKMSLLWYRGGDIDITEAELSKYNEFTSNMQHKSPPLKALIASKGTIRALVISVMCVIGFQSTGSLMIAANAVSIFEMCGTSMNAFQSAIVMESIQFCFGIFSFVIIDRIGRKPLFIGSLLAIGMALSTLGSYLCFFVGYSSDSILKWIPLMALSTHFIAYSIGPGPLLFIITTEIYPPEVKGLALAKLQLLNCTMTFLTVKLYPDMKRVLGPHNCFWFYGLLCFIMSGFMVLFLPETKGKSHDEIMRLLNKGDRTDETEKLRATPQECE